MKLQLYLNGMEVELNESVSLPITKTYESLSNPTNIHIDYSKSINIPITPQNTKIFGQIFKLDRVISVSDIVGLNFDPTKRMDCQLIYNGDLLMDGYAKFVSVSNSVSNRYFTINLFGRLGDIFQKMLQVAVDESKLPDDLDSNYVLDDHIPSDTLLNKEFVYDSWMNDTPILKLSSANPTDIIGFAPTYHGYDPDFDSKSIQTNPNTIVPLEDYIKNQYKSTYKSLYPSSTNEQVQSFVDSLGVGEYIGDGFKDYEMYQYRSYNQKPYIYFNKLVQMFQETFPKITDYKLKLDSDWFNVNNPYWYRLCYMLDYIKMESTDTTNESINVVFDKGQEYNFSLNDYVYTYETSLSEYSVKISPFNINLSTSTNQILGKRQRMFLENKSVIKMDILDDADYILKTIYFTGQYNSLPESYFGENERYYINEQTNFDGTITTYNASCPVPPIAIASNSNLKLKLTIYREKEPQDDNGVFGLGYITNSDNYWYKLITPSPLSFSTDKTINNNSLIPLSLKSLYKKDTPLFEIILQYTKMFGLVWDIDYINKEVWIKTKNNYFKDYTITDWSDKLDKTNEFVITPPLFDSNSIEFNYENPDGYVYSGYKERYNVGYGEKILYPEYEFNTQSKKLFDKINPSIVSSRSYRDYYKTISWNFQDTLISGTTKNTVIEDASEDDKSPLGLNNWFFRCKNYITSPENPTFITDDSKYQLSTNQKCYYNLNAFDNSDFDSCAIRIMFVPKFSVVYDNYGCIFNKPQEDYTATGEVTNTQNYIYDLQWNDYVNERYNIQNKKLGTDFNLSILDLCDFKYSDFVTVSNQLFIVNKITDFKLENPAPTQTELETITDIESYASGGTFQPIYSNVDDGIVIDLRGQSASANKRFEITIFTDEQPYAVEFSDSKISVGTSVKYNDKIRYIFIITTGMNTSTTINYSTITFRNSYGTLTIPVTIVGGGVINI